MKASECKCVDCGKQAVAFWPVIDPDIPSHPYCRECWSEDASLWLKPAAQVQAEWCKDPILKDIAERNGGYIDAQGTICAHLNGAIVTGFTPLQEDMLAEDWSIVYFE